MMAIKIMDGERGLKEFLQLITPCTYVPASANNYDPKRVFSAAKNRT